MSFYTAVIRSNPISCDARAIKIIQSLSKKYKVIVLGWDREAIYGPFEFIGRNTIIKRFKLRAPYGKIQLVLFYPLFWTWVLINLFIYRPKIVHACDLDSLLPCYVFKVLFPTKLVFDSFDRYAMAFIPPKHHMLYKFVNWLEALLAYRSDALITVSKERLLSFGRYRPKHIEVIMNCPRDKPEMLKLGSGSNKHANEDLTLVYAGVISVKRGLHLIERALREIEGVRLILAGRVIDDIIGQLTRNPKIKYVGLLNYDAALKLQALADVIPVLYDPSIPINRVANPNKLFEAMMLGVPVITNVCNEIVNEVGCGLVVEYDSSSIKAAILRLKNNPSLRRRMGVRGRMAFEKIYNWSLMEKKLIRLYSRLLTE